MLESKLQVELQVFGPECTFAFSPGMDKLPGDKRHIPISENLILTHLKFYWFLSHRLEYTKAYFSR